MDQDNKAHPTPGQPAPLHAKPTRQDLRNLELFWQSQRLRPVAVAVSSSKKQKEFHG